MRSEPGLDSGGTLRGRSTPTKIIRGKQITSSGPSASSDFVTTSLCAKHARKPVANKVSLLLVLIFPATPEITNPNPYHDELCRIAYKTYSEEIKKGCMLFGYDIP